MIGLERQKINPTKNQYDKCLSLKIILSPNNVVVEKTVKNILEKVQRLTLVEMRKLSEVFFLKNHLMPPLSSQLVLVFNNLFFSSSV